MCTILWRKIYHSLLLHKIYYNYSKNFLSYFSKFPLSNYQLTRNMVITNFLNFPKDLFKITCSNLNKIKKNKADVPLAFKTWITKCHVMTICIYTNKIPTVSTNSLSHYLLKKICRDKAYLPREANFNIHVSRYKRSWLALSLSVEFFERGNRASS